LQTLAKMFLSLKRKFSSALMSASLVISLLLATYMLQQVSNLYQEYQKASRLEGYLGDLEGVMEDTEKLRSGVETLEHQYSVLGKAMKESLNIKLAHDKGR